MLNINKMKADGWGVYQFSNINEFIKKLDSTECRSSMDPSSHRDSRNQSCGCSNYQESRDLLKYGWKEQSMKLTVELRKIDKGMTAIKTKTRYDLAGHAPQVARYLMNQPMSMIRNERVEKETRILNVYQQIGTAGMVTNSQMIKEATQIMLQIQQLELQGFRVNLYLMDGALSLVGRKREKACLTIKLKSANEPLNISKLSFVMCHPAMARIFVFEATENFTDIFLGDWHSYGAPLQKRNILPYLEPDKGDVYFQFGDGGSADLAKFIDDSLKKEGL